MARKKPKTVEETYASVLKESRELDQAIPQAEEYRQTCYRKLVELSPVAKLNDFEWQQAKREFEAAEKTLASLQRRQVKVRRHFSALDSILRTAAKKVPA